MSISQKSGGLAGVTAGVTAISTVGKAGRGLRYRGYAIEELAAEASFEEVAFLLLVGHLPNRSELTEFTEKLIESRALPKALVETLSAIPPSAHPMDVLRTGCSMLGVLEGEANAIDPLAGDPSEWKERQLRAAIRLLGSLPSMLLYWFHVSRDRGAIDFRSNETSVAGFFLEKLLRQTPSDEHRRAIDASLVLYAEHEFNASTFAARVCTATRSDLFSAITASIGTLRGPLHGGANEAAMGLMEQFDSPDAAEAGIVKMLAEKRLIMGFGHRVYTESDPRSDVVKRWAQKLCFSPQNKRLLEIAERIESVMWREKRLFPNLDFYSAIVYHVLEIETALFTPIFVLSRTAGWCAHIFEQRANNRLIRPAAQYVGPDDRPMVPLDARAIG